MGIAADGRIALKMGDATSAIFPARFRSTTPGACSDPEGRSPRLDSASAARDLDLPDWMIVSGRHLQHGLEQSDLGGGGRVHQGWRKTFRRSAARRRDPQPGARASLVSPAFGRPCPAYGSSAQALEYFASRTHAVGIRLTEADGPSASMTSFRFDHRTHHRQPGYAPGKGARARNNWPEITVVPC